MAIPKNQGRQEVIAASVVLKYDEITDDTGADEAAISVPAGARVVGGNVTIDTVFNSTTSDVLTCGDATDPNRYLATPADLTSATASYPLDGVLNKVYPVKTDITVAWTAGATGTATQGEAVLTVMYVEDGRSAFAQD